MHPVLVSRPAAAPITQPLLPLSGAMVSSKCLNKMSITSVPSSAILCTFRMDPESGFPDSFVFIGRSHGKFGILKLHDCNAALKSDGDFHICRVRQSVTLFSLGADFVKPLFYLFYWFQQALCRPVLLPRIPQRIVNGDKASTSIFLVLLSKAAAESAR